MKTLPAHLQRRRSFLLIAILISLIASILEKDFLYYVGYSSNSVLLSSTRRDDPVLVSINTHLPRKNTCLLSFVTTFFDVDYQIELIATLFGLTLFLFHMGPL